MRATPIDPKAIDEAIAKHYPEASEEARAGVRARVEKRYQRAMEQHEHRARPSIGDSFANSPTLEHLTMLRDAVMLGLRGGNIDADRRTVEKWEEAMWSRLLYFLATAPTIQDATYVVNHSITWLKPAHIQTILDALAAKKFKSFP